MHIQSNTGVTDEDWLELETAKERIKQQEKRIRSKVEETKR